MGRLLWWTLSLLGVQVARVSREEAAAELMGEAVSFVWRPTVITKGKP